MAGVVTLVTLLGAVNVIGIKPSARAGDVIDAIKVLGLVAFVAVADSCGDDSKDRYRDRYSREKRIAHKSGMLQRARPARNAQLEIRT
jgi:hypothetical protein